MKHFRPIKTFATWLLESVTVELVPGGKDDWSGSKAARQWIEENLNLTKLDRFGFNRLESAIYSNDASGFPKEGTPCRNNFYFPDAESANLFHAKFGGQRQTLPVEQGPRRNEPICDNFTLDDLVYLYGDPLPNVIQFHLVDMDDRLGGYFDRFQYMHQPWSRRSHWLPSAFVYVSHAQRVDDAPLKWLYQTLFRPEDPENFWQHGWQSSIHGIYEFDDPKVAAMFKLAFGGGAIPSKLTYRSYETYDRLAGPVSGIQPLVDSFGTWARQANIPDYRNPLEVG